MKAYKEEISYTFICKECGSLLEADSNDFEVVGRNLLRYTCPICMRKHMVKYNQLSKKVKYV